MKYEWEGLNLSEWQKVLLHHWDDRGVHTEWVLFCGSEDGVWYFQDDKGDFMLERQYILSISTAGMAV